MRVRRIRELADAPEALRESIFRRALEFLARDGEGSGFFVEVDDPSTYWIAGLRSVEPATPRESLQ